MHLIFYTSYCSEDCQFLWGKTNSYHRFFSENRNIERQGKELGQVIFSPLILLRLRNQEFLLVSSCKCRLLLELSVGQARVLIAENTQLRSTLLPRIQKHDPGKRVHAVRDWDPHEGSGVP